MTPEKVGTIHPGTHPECSPTPDPMADPEAARLLGPIDPKAVELLHVGTNIPRKRIDILLATFAGVRKTHPRARLVKVGGSLTAEQSGQAESLGIARSIVILPPLDRATLSAVYRRATIVLQPSEAEGFGLPVAEAMACETSVLASDLPVLREVAGESAVYRIVGDIEGWIEAALAMIAGRGSEEASRRRDLGLDRASRYGWMAHAEALSRVYRKFSGSL